MNTATKTNAMVVLTRLVMGKGGARTLRRRQGDRQVSSCQREGETVPWSNTMSSGDPQSATAVRVQSVAARPSRFVIRGGRKLQGEIVVGGMKNATTPILAATLLASEPCVIRNVPRISDV